MVLINSGDLQLDEIISQWIEWDNNLHTKNEVLDLIEQKDWPTLDKLMRPRLSFGTSGFRGIMRPGFACFNELVVIQITQGLTDFITRRFPDKKDKLRGIAVGYDARRDSKRFAELTVTILLNHGYNVLFFQQEIPISIIAFTVKEKKCLAGVMITASHNTRDYNGYKIWWEDGVHFLPPLETELELTINRRLQPDATSWETRILHSTSVAAQLIDPFEDIIQLYCQKIQQLLPTNILEHNSCSQLQFAYTAMHGVAYQTFKVALNAFSLPNVMLPVEEQQQPNSNFPTIHLWSIENYPQSLERAINLANKEGLNLVMAHNCDAGHLICAEQDILNSEWKVLTGNELGVLLGWWTWHIYKQKNKELVAANCYMLGSTVSTRFLAALAKAEGFKYEETLSGFKWLGQRAKQLINSGKEVLFAFEEAGGFMVSSNVLYKDGISAGCHLATFINYVKAVENLTLRDKLKQLYAQYGYHVNISSYFHYEEYALIRELFANLRSCSAGQDATYPTHIMNEMFRIVHVRDITLGLDTFRSDGRATLPESSQEMITFTFENGVIISVRVSGTEQIIKYYAEFAVRPFESDWHKYDSTLNHMVQALINELLQPARYRLSAP